MQRAIFFTIYYVCFTLQVWAQGIKGTIKNEAGALLPYVNLFVSGTQIGTNTNVDGAFTLRLNPGSYKIVVQSIDYKTQVFDVSINQDWFSLNPVLAAQTYVLKELNISGKKENSANFIMRKAIGAAPYYNRQVLKYHAKVYVKGTGRIDESPSLLKPALKSLGVVVGKSYLTESVNELQFLQPATYKEKVISISSTMPYSETPKPMRMIRGSWYASNSKEIISPLSPEAFSVYRFTLTGSYYENGREINKIRVEPKRAGNDVFNGDIYIVEGLWCIHSLVLTRKEQSMIVTTKTSFEALPNFPYVWMPVRYDFTAQGDYLGVKGSYRYFVSIKDYHITLNPNLNHQWVQKQLGTPSVSEKELVQPEQEKVAIKPNKNQEKIAALLQKENLNKREMLQLAGRMKQEAEKETQQLLAENDSTEIVIDSLAFTKDSSFWSAERGVPLLQQEIQSLEEKAKKDTSSKKLSSTGYKFSLGNALLYGDSIPFKSGKFFGHTGLLPRIYLNTVEGFGLNLHLRYGNTQPNNWLFTQDLKMPIERFLPQFVSTFSYRFNPQKLGWWQVSIGSIVTDYNSQGIDRIADAFQILFYQRNFSKWYQQDFIAAQWQRELFTGFQVRFGAMGLNRFSLDNIDRFAQKERAGSYTHNLPIAQINREQHHSYQFKIGASYAFKQVYRMKYNRKQYLANEWPSIGVNYTEAWDKNLQFRQLVWQLKQAVFLRHWVKLSYQVEQGFFFHQNRMYFQDFKHFGGNQSWLYTDNLAHRFKQLPYYAYSTNNTYETIGLNLDFKKIIIKQIPLFQLVDFKESIHVNALNTREHGNYFETGYGLTEIANRISLGSNFYFINQTYGGWGFWLNLRL